ncbi:DUF389 domain-containing protein [Beutenbergia cavernae]|uniref:DUF389 domain-containing protein n=1 Tax=Beutenbergia cavernae TaxID=84757 RepID=UPI00019AC4CF|nr:DUF389 domain-containing protein [Beutenbergia cavernae]
MLSVRVIAPRETCRAVTEIVKADPTVANLAVVRGATLDGGGDLVLFDVARENANEVIGALRGLGIESSGSITLTEPLAVISLAADRAEEEAPGHPADGVVWDQIEDQARNDARPSWSFMVFLVLATLIAGIGRYLDQPILIIAAMVVGPEFAPVAAICIALARRRLRLVPEAALTLIGGFAIATVFSWAVWAIAYAFGAIDRERATTGPLTEFIVSPDIWSFLIALLAGCAGVLSLTTAKSSALVGVFISVTTVPAVGTIALTLAVGEWGEAWSSLIQLGINLLGLLVAGTVTLLVQRFAWERFGRMRPRPAHRGRRAAAAPPPSRP